MDGKRLFAWLVVLGVSAPAPALADTCAEDNETCVDSCGTDHGLKRDRTPLQRCLAQCDERLEDCKDQRSEDRNTYGRARDDLPPAPRKDTQAWQETPAEPEPEPERADSWRAGDDPAPPAQEPRPAKRPERFDTAFEEPAVRPPEEQAEPAANEKPEPVAEERQVSEYPNPTPEPPPEPRPAPELRRQESSDDSSDWGEP